MAFLQTTGKPTALRQPVALTFPKAVDRVTTACGLAPVVTVESPSKHVQIAMAAVNDATTRVFTAAKWQWSTRWAYLRMEDGVFGYQLPADYARYGKGLANSNPNRDLPMQYVGYDYLVSQYPQLAVVSGVESAELNLGDLSQVLQQVSANDSLNGRPVAWSVEGSRLFLFPIPQDSYYTERGEFFDEDGLWLFSYHPTMKRMTVDTDTLPIPYDLHMIVHWLALGYFKQALEYPDATADENRGEGLLRTAIVKNKQATNDTYSIMGA